MSKKNIVTEDEDFRYLEENFEEMMKEMEKDKETHEYQIPQIWDYDFRKTIDETLEKEQCKRSRKRMRNLSIAAGIALVTLVGVDRSLVAVQGDGIKEVVESTFNLEERTFVTFDTNGKQGEESNEIDEIYFSSNSLTEAYQEIEKKVLYPIFYIGYMPEDYQLIEAKYNTCYRILNMEWEKDNQKIYVSQQFVMADEGTGAAVGRRKEKVIENTILKKKIELYKSEQDESRIFLIKYNNMMFSFNGNVSLEECEKIAENIFFE